MAVLPDTAPLEEPLAELERLIIDDYLRKAGHDASVLRARTDAEAKDLLTMAAAYASGRLSEVEARLHYLRSLRGQE